MTDFTRSRSKPILTDNTVQNEAIQEYVSGISLADLSRKYGTSPAYLRKLLKGSGVATRSAVEQAKLDAAKFKELYGDEILSRYNAGESAKSICKDLGLYPAQIRTLLNENNIGIRKGPHKHGLAGTPEYKVWKGVRKRIFNKNAQNYKYYGGRGIQMCSYLAGSAKNFVDLMGNKPTPEHTLDRIDNDGHYSCGECEDCKKNGWPMNLRWATHKENCRNTSIVRTLTFRGETRCVNEWIEITGITALKTRLNAGWDIEKALTTPMDMIGNQPNLTPAELTDPIISMYSDGNSLMAIADHFKLSQTAVRNVLTRNGIEIRSRSEQAQLRVDSRNRMLTYNGKTQTIAQWARELGINGAAIRHRKNRGWSDEDALTTPLVKRHDQDHLGKNT